MPQVCLERNCQESVLLLLFSISISLTTSDIWYDCTRRSPITANQQYEARFFLSIISCLVLVSVMHNFLMLSSSNSSLLQSFHINKEAAPTHYHVPTHICSSPRLRTQDAQQHSATGLTILPTTSVRSIANS